MPVQISSSNYEDPGQNSVDEIFSMNMNEPTPQAHVESIQ